LHHGTASDVTVASTATVSDPSVTGVGGFTYTATEGGTSTSQTVATFTDPGGAEALGNYSADIDWGDGTSTTSGVIAVNAQTHVFTVSGQHAYADEGTFAIHVTLHHGTSSDVTVASTAAISPGAAIVHSPTANPDTFVLGPGAAVCGSGATSVLANDVSADNQPGELVATVVMTTTHGKLALNPDGSFTNTPNSTFQGIDRFTYQVSERGVVGNTVTVTLLSYNASLVDKLYHQVLHRSAEDAGLIGWTAGLDKGMPLDEIAQDIFNSPERLNPLVNQFYEQYLNRPAEPAGLAAWVAVWQKTGDPGEVQDDILASQEFYNDAGDTVDGFVRLLYERVLGRQPDATGLAGWDAGLNSGKNTRQQTAAGFLNSGEFHIDTVDFLFGEYFGNPNPTPAQAQPYVTDLNNGQTRTQVELAMINSPTYSEAPPEPAAGMVGIALYPH
jgi:hypothetical protein